jgi:hypothetical protein
MLADTTGSHLVLTGAKNSFSAEASPATHRDISQFIHIMEIVSAYLTLDIRNPVRGERKFIQRNLGFLEVPQKAELTL